MSKEDGWTRYSRNELDGRYFSDEQMIHDVSDNFRAEIQLVSIFLIDAERG